MIRLQRMFSAFMIAVFVTGCAPTAEPPALTPLEIQALQSRQYETSKEVAFASVVSVFQDIGYIISNADFQTGLISAESPAISGDFDKRFWLGITTVTQTKATAFVEKIGAKANVRLNFVEVENESSVYGQTDRSDTPILDVKIYENAFEKVANAIFIRSVN